MKCKQCNNELYIGQTTFESPKDTDEVKAVQNFYCPNSKCALFEKKIRIETTAP